MDRRSALKGIGLIIASATAPAIIPIKSIMPVKQIIKPADFRTYYAKTVYSQDGSRFPDFMALVRKELASALGVSVDVLDRDVDTTDFNNGNGTNTLVGTILKPYRKAVNHIARI